MTDSSPARRALGTTAVPFVIRVVDVHQVKPKLTVSCNEKQTDGSGKQVLV